MRTWDQYKTTMKNEETLWSAAKEGNLFSIVTLLKAGADLNARDHRGYSPLMLAVYAGQIETSKLLLELGADANSSDFSGNTILMGASFKGHLTLVKALIEREADLLVQNSTGMTAYDFAVTFGRIEVAEFLKERGGARKVAPSRAGGFFKILLSRFVRPSAPQFLGS